ncbi:MAG TPA: hypothetical protein VF598_04085 [Hymenobacter sp.]|jgi:hypothetical protein
MITKSIQSAAWLLGSLCALSAAKCTSNELEREDPAPQLVEVRYVQTQCSDRWGPAPSTQALVTTARAYLAQRGLTLYQPQAIVQNTGAVCSACSCPTGVVLEGSVAPAEVAAVLALGFTKK